jgi:hypothetical protein
MELFYLIYTLNLESEELVKIDVVTANAPLLGDFIF